MRNILSALLISATMSAVAESLPADSLVSGSAVARFYAGCMKIVEAESARDSIAANSAYAEAMDLLNTRSTYSRKGIPLGKMKAQVVDDSGLASETPHDFAYDYTYARSRYKCIDFAPSGMSRGFGNGCRVLDLVLKPGGAVKCREKVSGDCLLVAMAQPGGSIGLEVKASDGRSVDVRSYEDGLVGYAHWQNGQSDFVDYVVTNLTDKELTVTLFAN